MPLAFFLVSLLGALLVLNVYFPIKHEPLSVISFSAGGFLGEAPLQTIALQVAATVAFGIFGAFDAAIGFAGLGLAVAGWAGLIGLAVLGARTADIVTRALEDSTGGPVRVEDDARTSRWINAWRITLGVPVRSPGIQMKKHIDYWGDGLHHHRLDVYHPRGEVSAGAPVLIYIHGGAWMIGDKREQGKPMMFELVSRGWVCVSVNYRLSPKATWPDHIVDCKRAISWVRQHISEYGGDPSFLAVSGGSAGGHLAALVALSANDAVYQPGFEAEDTSVDACIPFYGVMDMTGSKSGSGRYGPGLRKLLEQKVMKVKSGEQSEVFAKASPTFRVHAGAPPFFVLQGTHDTLVPVDVAREFVRALTAVSDAPVAYAEIPYAQHAFDILTSLRSRATTAGVVTFLDAVRPRRTAGQPVGASPSETEI